MLGRDFPKAGQPNPAFQDLLKNDREAGTYAAAFSGNFNLERLGQVTGLIPKFNTSTTSSFLKKRKTSVNCSKSQGNSTASVLFLPNSKRTLKRPNHYARGSKCFLLSDLHPACCSCSLSLSFCVLTSGFRNKSPPTLNRELRAKQRRYLEGSHAVLRSGIGAVKCSLPFGSGTRISLPKPASPTAAAGRKSLRQHPP